MRLPFSKHFLVIFVVNLVVAGLALAVQTFLPPEIPLFYGQPKGENQIAAKIFLILPSSSALVVSAFNLLLSKVIGNKFLEKVLIGISYTISALALITTLRIIFLVGNF